MFLKLSLFVLLISSCRTSQSNNDKGTPPAPANQVGAAINNPLSGAIKSLPWTFNKGVAILGKGGSLYSIRLQSAADPRSFNCGTPGNGYDTLNTPQDSSLTLYDVQIGLTKGTQSATSQRNIANDQFTIVCGKIVPTGSVVGDGFANAQIAITGDDGTYLSGTLSGTSTDGQTHLSGQFVVSIRDCSKN